MEINQKIKPAFSVNLDTLLHEQNLSGKDLAKMIPTSEQTISKARSGIRLSNSMARRIIELFPNYNLSWLLGISEYKTNEEVSRAFQKVRELESREAEMRRYDFFSSIAYIAEYCGFGADFDGAILTIEERPKAFPDDNPLGIDLNAASTDCDELREDIVAFMKYRLQKAIDRGH